MKKLIVLILAAGLVAAGCNSTVDSVNCEFNEQEMLANYSDGIIIPRFDELSLSLVLLESSIQQFAATPSVGLLNECRIMYGLSYQQYQECSMFSFGPGMINGVSFRDRFNTFPANTTTINDNIQSGASVESSPRSAVGFPAIDYLLFGEPGSSNAEVLALFTSDPNASARLAFLTALVAEMKTTTNSIVNAWSASGGNYRDAFVANVGTAEGTSIGLLVNEFNYDFETLKNFKFKIPLGKYNGGIVLPAQVEGYYSGVSNMLVERHVTAFKEMFEGVSANGTDGLGLYEYVACLETKTPNGALLADAIKDQFQAISSSVSAIPAPLSGALVSDKQLVEDAYTNLSMMVPLIKYEMTSALAVQINYQDNDGD